MKISSEQQAFLESSGKTVLCACPGSGKTFVVAKKLLKYIENWDKPHQGIAALSFTNVASEEIQKQANDISIYIKSINYPHFIGTIDSFFDKYIFLRFAYLLMSNPKRPIVTIDNYYTFPFRYWRKECYKNGCIENINTFRWGIDGYTYKNSNKINCNPGDHGNPCDQYKTMLLNKGVFFQNDISTLSWRILNKYPQISKAIADRFPVIILDEAQDTSIEQMAVLDLLANAGIRSFYLVGDPDQAIYKWRSATPECFLNKMSENGWTTKYLNENYRSSQKICNATQAFSNTLIGKSPNIAVGDSKNFEQKPELIFFNGNVTKEQVYNYFLNKCCDLGIEQNSNQIAVLTRGKIHKDTEINNLWKSCEIELFAKATFEWYCGSKKKAYDYCEKAFYSMLIDDISTVTPDLQREIDKIISYDLWKENVLKIVCNLPDINSSLEIWVTDMKALLNSNHIVLSFRTGHEVNNVIKIKSRDKENPMFKDLPLKDFFELKNKDNITISSIHGVKGETYDAILLYISSSRGGNTLTPSLLAKGDLNSELIRIAYVAMTRPRKYLAVAMPKPATSTLSRFPKSIWEYVELN